MYKKLYSYYVESDLTMCGIRDGCNSCLVGGNNFDFDFDFDFDFC
jgi:hypothetical protein